MNALSETLRYEMMPLGVKVITLMAGNVKSNIEANREPLDLPPTSYYLPIKDSMAESADFTEMPTEKFAEGVVNDTLGGVSGYIWKGGNTGILRWLLPVLPWFVVVSFVFHVTTYNTNSLVGSFSSHQREGH